jgi:MFS transporter, DHA1 family, multidrug resistance protein
VSRAPFRLFALLAACASVGPIQLNVYLPSLPLVQAEFGASVAEVQWTVSLAMAAFGLGLLLLGPLSDRYGRRPVLMLGLGIFTLASAAASFAPDLGVLTAARAVQSIGASIVFITARAVVADLTPRDSLQRSVAQLTMIMLMGQMIAPLIGSFVMSYGGWRVIQYCLTALGAVLVCTVALRLRETRPSAAAQPEATPNFLTGLLRPTFDVLARRGFTLQLLQIGLLYSAYPAFVSIAPHLMIEVFHRPATDYAYYFALLPLGYFAGNAFVLRFGSAFTGAQLIRSGGLWASGAALLGAVSLTLGAWHPLALFLPAGLLLNFGLGLALPSASARAIRHAWPNTGSAWGLAGFTQQVMGACGVQLLGFFPADSPYPVLILCATLAGIPALLERWLRIGDATVKPAI